MIQNHKHYACATHFSLVVSRLHDAAARFRTGVKFSPRYKNRGELMFMAGWLAPAWHWWYHVNKYRAMRGNQSELAPGRKSPRCHVNTPYVARGHRLPLLNNIFFSALMAKLLQPAQFYLTKGSPHGSFHKPRLKIWKNDKAFSPRGLMTVQNLSSKWFQCLQIHTTE